MGQGIIGDEAPPHGIIQPVHQVMEKGFPLGVNASVRFPGRKKIAAVKDPKVIGDGVRDVRLDVNEETKDIGGGKGLELIQGEMMEFLELAGGIGKDVLIPVEGIVVNAFPLPRHHHREG